MQRYYLIGSPIAHSLSPWMMNYSFRTLGIDAEYGLMESDAGRIAETVSRLKEIGASGWNVTMPCKEAMAGLCDELSVASSIGGSVNTVKNEDGRLIGHTTDGIGLVWALSRSGVSIRGEKLTLLGTGGAATAILIQASLSGAAEISVFAHRPSSKEKVEAIAGKLVPHTDTRIRTFSLSDTASLKNELASSRVLIQATSVGMGDTVPGRPDCLIMDAGFLHENLFVYDIIYHPACTPLLALAKSCGVRCENGISMLVGQGAESFRIWTGLEMPSDDLIGNLLN